MIRRKWVLGTAVAALFAGAHLAAAPEIRVTSPAQAATDVNVSVGFNLFYDRLEPYGDWVSYESAYVWVPRKISLDWRPYTRGHWVYTREYGWMWVSDEPFGWATYHYGRWGFADEIGWYWLPGTRWAPAWVAWRRGDDHLAWAPLPPQDGMNISIEVNIDIDRLPRNYWIAVQSSRFLERDISRAVVFDETIIERSKPVGTVIVQNNTIINNVVNIEYVEKETSQKVAVRTVRAVNESDQTGTIEGDAIAIFNADVDGDQKMQKPKRARQAREVIEERKARVKAPDAEQTGTIPKVEEKNDAPQAEQEKLPSDPGSTESVTIPSEESDAKTVESNRKKRRLLQQQLEEQQGKRPPTDEAEEKGTTGTITETPKAKPEKAMKAVEEPKSNEAPAQTKPKKKLPDNTSGSVEDSEPREQVREKEQTQDNEATGSTNAVPAKKEKQKPSTTERGTKAEKPTGKKKRPCDPSEEECN